MSELKDVVRHDGNHSVRPVDDRLALQEEILRSLLDRQHLGDGESGNEQSAGHALYGVSTDHAPHQVALRQRVSMWTKPDDG